MAGEVLGSEAADSLIGKTLASRYQVEHRLGRGAMGTVYKARHVKIGRPFAVKVLHPELFIDNKSLQRFEREAELAGRLHHPNVIGIVDVGETDGMHYMVMDFVEGTNLATLIEREAPMPSQRIIQLCRQLLEGLFHAHEQGLIHRDLKPENVIVERDTHGAEIPRIVDFGISILRDSTASPDRLTASGFVLGTPRYMAPEQAVDDPIDHRIDLFALGVMLYEMLSGTSPFDGGGVEVARANLLRDPPQIAVRVPLLEVDPLLEAFARRLMAKSRDHRPATAKAARELLDLIVTDRHAAGVELGVSPEARVPLLTRPVTLSDVAYPDTLVMASLQAPTMRTPLVAAVELPSVVRSVKRDIATVVVPSLDTMQMQHRRRRWPIIGLAIGGVAVIGLATAVLVGRLPRDVESAPSAILAADAIPVAALEPVDAATAVEPQVEVPEPVDPPPIVHPIDRSRPVKAKPKPIEVETVGTEALPKPVDARTLAAQFQMVGAELRALAQTRGSDATSDLRARFSLIEIVDAMSTQPKRDAATVVLAKLHEDIAARKAA
ncbi:MAG: serine/threonine-protein kinase [Kofleriaceae bacterium]